MISISQHVNLAPYTSWQIGGSADFFCLPETIEQVAQAQKMAQEKAWPLTILGGGSNVLISDKGVRGLTICLKRFSKINVIAEHPRLEMECLSGTSKSDLLKIFLKNKLPPALFLAGLPGDVGGGVVMNAGVAEGFVPREFVELVDTIEVLKPDGKTHIFHKSQLQWSYRHCEGWQPGIILKTTLSWPNQQDETVLEKVKQANRTRLSKQPLDMPSCGSVFRNPQEKTRDGVLLKAAQLIDQCGLKGFRIGDAQISTKHANFIVNLGQAKAQDTWSLIQTVQAKVQEAFGVQLQPEVVRLGDWHE